MKTTPMILAVALAASCAHQDGSKTSSSQGPELKPRILVILSGSDYVTTMEGNKHPTGYFLSELAGPAIALKRSGHELVFATPGGRMPAMDAVSDDAKWFKSQEAYDEARLFIESTPDLGRPHSLESLAERDLDKFSGLLVPGGHAPLEDLFKSGDVARILAHFHVNGKPTGLICHGPAALLSAKTGSGWLYAGYRMTGFSTAEEKQEEDAGHLDGHMPYYLDQELSRLGGIVEVASPWQSKAVRDRELITGQNPMSEEEFIGFLLEALMEGRVIGKTPTRLIPGGKIRKGEFYTIAEPQLNPNDWNSGYRTLWIGSRTEGNVSFLERLAPHVDLTWQTFKSKGLEGYVVYATDEYEIAFQRWTSKEASENAFASQDGQAVIQDAGLIMKSVLFKEIAHNPFANR